MRALWPVVAAVLIRLVVWLWVPASQFASDEDSYYQVATALLARGHQDLFWPPVTGWLIALTRWLLQTDAVSAIRLVWIGFDLGCLAAVGILATRVVPAVSGGDLARATRFTVAVTLAYALYLPAISFAQFTTSETPALLQTLIILVLLTRPQTSAAVSAMAGVLAGTLTLTRPSLLPLLVLLPLARYLGEISNVDVRRARTAAVVFTLAGTTVVAAVMARNLIQYGDFTIARNSAYNLYIGNRDMYGEDLDLFSPRATAGQIEFRRQMWSGELVYPTGSPSELQREAFSWIAEHPSVFLRRALGRLARVFAPRTDVLELAGGERAAGIFSPVSLGLLVVANLQWTVILFAGIPGLMALRRFDRRTGFVLLAAVLGALPLCLIAISKPRYSFTFDPVLLLGAAVFLSSPGQAWAALGRGERLIVAAFSLFVLWGWAAWLVFALSSRMAP